jgi:hypothetical protein
MGPAKALYRRGAFLSSGRLLLKRARPNVWCHTQTAPKLINTINITAPPAVGFTFKGIKNRCTLGGAKGDEMNAGCSGQIEIHK